MHGIVGETWDRMLLLSSALCLSHSAQHSKKGESYPSAQWLLLEIFVQKLFETNHNFRYKQVKKSEKKGTLIISILKRLSTGTVNASIFFGFLTLWGLKW